MKPFKKTTARMMLKEEEEKRGLSFPQASSLYFSPLFFQFPADVRGDRTPDSDRCLAQQAVHRLKETSILDRSDVCCKYKHNDEELTESHRKMKAFASQFLKYH